MNEAVAQRVMESLAGPGARLRDDQRTAVEALLQPAARVLVVQATGWGKSAVYWVGTALRRADGAGPTLVVSPLLALMRDQVAAAERAGLRAATLNSGNIEDWDAIEGALAAGEIDVLLVSPERLANPSFGTRVMRHLAGRLGLLVVDEAHAVSDWGHDFRPDYRRVADAIAQLNPDTPILATTATANARVTADVAAQLGDQTLVLRGRLSRDSLQLAVIDGMTGLQRYAWVVQTLPRMHGSGIVYVLTVADAERLTEAIRHVHGAELPVAAYTGQLSVEDRERAEDALRRNELKALIATSALGMGYDKPDLGFCVHVDAPPSPVSYYQQVGRAGRAIEHASVVLLSSADDTGVWDYFATASIPDQGEVERLLAALPRDRDESVSVPALESETGLRRTKVELLLKQLAVDGVTERVPSGRASGWIATGKPWHYDREHYDGVLATRRREADIMRAYARGQACLMQLLQQALDDPDAAPCGRCSVCTGGLPLDLPERPSLATTQAVADLLRAGTTVIEPRKMWPGGAFGRRGRISPDELVDEGRALMFADAPEWADLRAAAFDAARPPGELPDGLLDAVVGVLSRWRWASRPEVVLGLPAAGHADLVDAVVREICRVGRLEAGELEFQPGTPPGQGLGSAAEATLWRDRVSGAVGVSGRVVLLVVDATATLWPVTMAGAAVRRAGAVRVLPLVLHRRAG